MVFGANLFYPLAALTKTVPVISCGGLAKHYLIPGWRVGWITVNDRNDVLKDVRTAYFKLSQLILGANSLVQSAIPDLLTPVPGSAEANSLAEFKAHYFSTLEKNSKFTTDALSRIPGLKVVVPQGAMYVMVGVDTSVLTGIKDDFDFTQKLLDEESVFVLPGQVGFVFVFYCWDGLVSIEGFLICCRNLFIAVLWDGQLLPHRVLGPP